MYRISLRDVSYVEFETPKQEWSDTSQSQRSK